MLLGGGGGKWVVYMYLCAIFVAQIAQRGGGSCSWLNRPLQPASFLPLLAAPSPTRMLPRRGKGRTTDRLDPQDLGARRGAGSALSEWERMRPTAHKKWAVQKEMK